VSVSEPSLHDELIAVNWLPAEAEKIVTAYVTLLTVGRPKSAQWLRETAVNQTACAVAERGKWFLERFPEILAGDVNWD
jgi:hypothetical protein